MSKLMSESDIAADAMQKALDVFTRNGIWNAAIVIAWKDGERIETRQGLLAPSFSEKVITKSDLKATAALVAAVGKAAEDFVGDIIRGGEASH